ncbi:hypothetical protein SFHH103_03430 [Sinorhizobium fredii HH103]|uniref:Uncharacterized protein n=1 Tax=Sinorhizobium fredii (strain HH103) TaxID=1117943 RepID=G9A3H3_SINF1|nr:hypothetical protein SFHH103_03430 [Sinorhizobium fredii HH103]
MLRQYAFYRYVPEAAESVQIPAANLTIILRRDTRPEKKNRSRNIPEAVCESII